MKPKHHQVMEVILAIVIVKQDHLHKETIMETTIIIQETTIGITVIITENETNSMILVPSTMENIDGRCVIKVDIEKILDPVRTTFKTTDDQIPINNINNMQPIRNGIITFLPFEKRSAFPDIYKSRNFK